ncbi:acetylglucosaminyltransferase [Schizosaccharomyces japonicus yFS275]|uniref:Acetylglucosaminyltransferase n=1 Tax=Schizosaccharomyces japonicus (strain yFS275 / FY16936) TaxID=402676 RepID=B6K3G5_SCHJY|nr:acetylglucosaminyltransferase [Schizosaccharomyces japonicus yFS275]EEB08022.1 acetylglucosaminyltransferase [Schizosaccharomyces japonicus yFS275]
MWERVCNLYKGSFFVLSKRKFCTFLVAAVGLLFFGVLGLIPSIKNTIVDESWWYRLVNLPPSPRMAYVTMLTVPPRYVDAEDEERPDWYYNSTRLLVHRLVRYPETKSKYPVVVMAMRGVDEWKLQQLREDGAIVQVVEPLHARDVVDNIDDMEVADPRWLYMFTKLRVFEMFQYDRLCFIDSDMLPIRNMDGVFNVHEIMERKTSSSYKPPALTYRPKGSMKNAEFEEDWNAYGVDKEELYPYVFAAVSDPGEWHTTPPPFKDFFNAGLFVFRPSKAHWKRLRYLARKPYFYDNARMMEQSLLNFAFHSKGAFPWEHLDWTYNGVWARKTDLPFLKVIHGKLWQGADKMGFDYDTSAVWWQAYGEMIAYHKIIYSPPFGG